MHYLVLDNSGTENTYLPEDRCSLHLTKNYKNHKSYRITWSLGSSSLIDLGRPEKFRYVARVYG
jgi:hypothetical protein